MIDKFEFCTIYCKDGEKFSALIKVNMIKEIRDELKQNKNITYLDHGESEHEVKSIRVSRTKKDKVSCSRIVIFADGLLGSWEDIFRKKSDLCEDSFKHLEIGKYCVIRTDLLSAQKLLHSNGNFKLIKQGNYVFEIGSDKIKYSEACADCRAFLIRDTIVTEGTADYAQKQEEENIVMCEDSLIRLMEVYTYPTESTEEIGKQIEKRLNDGDYGYKEILMQSKEELKEDLQIVDEFLGAVQRDDTELEKHMEKFGEFRRRIFVTFQRAYMRQFKGNSQYLNIITIINSFDSYDEYELEAIVNSEDVGDEEDFSSNTLSKYDELKEILNGNLRPMKVIEDIEPYKEKLIFIVEKILGKYREILEEKSNEKSSVFSLIEDFRKNPDNDKLKVIYKGLISHKNDIEKISSFETEELKKNLLTMDRLLAYLPKEVLRQKPFSIMLNIRSYYTEELVRREYSYYNNLPPVQVFKQMYERFPTMGYVDCITLIKVLNQLPIDVDTTTEAIIKQDIYECAGVYSSICISDCKFDYEKAFIGVLTDTIKRFVDACREKINSKGKAPKKFSCSQALGIDRELLIRPSITNFIELHKSAIYRLSDKTVLTNKHIKELMDACEYLSKNINIITCAKGDTDEIMALSNILVLFTTTLNEKLSKKYGKASNNTKGTKIEAFKA